jgi:hypothetical protein
MKLSYSEYNQGNPNRKQKITEHPTVGLKEERGEKAKNSSHE